MNQKSASRNRKEIKAKMATIFNDTISSLPREYIGIFLDDMVTAFENRLNVLNRAYTKSGSKAAR